MTNHSTRWFGRLVIIFVVVASCELLAFLATSFLIRQNLLFCPLLITEPYEFYQQRFRPALGWPPKNILEIRPKFYDTSLSRQNPAFPDPNRTPAHISVYGDSFTEAWGVHHEHAWSNILSMLLNCRVSNFGVAGYGTDQAYLRFLQNTQDPAKVVILGIYTNNIKRNVNQLRNLIQYVTTCQTKPRFILNNQGKLTLVPIPPLSKSDYYGIRHHPDRFFHHEFFLPGGPSGRQLAKFPYLWRMFKASYFLVKSRGRGDNYQDFYQPGHPSRGLEVTTAIVKEFCHAAQKRGKRPVILIIPTDYDIQIFQRRQKFIYQPLLDRLAESPLDYIDAGPKIIQYLDGADRRTLYSPQISNHLNEEGNRLLARILYDYLTTNNILTRISDYSCAK
jgi:lysophospholipase L1-like esterase